MLCGFNIPAMIACLDVSQLCFGSWVQNWYRNTWEQFQITVWLAAAECDRYVLKTAIRLAGKKKIIYWKQNPCLAGGLIWLGFTSLWI